MSNIWTNSAKGGKEVEYNENVKKTADFFQATNYLSKIFVTEFAELYNKDYIYTLDMYMADNEQMQREHDNALERKKKMEKSISSIKRRYENLSILFEKMKSEKTVLTGLINQEQDFANSKKYNCYAIANKYMSDTTANAKVMHVAIVNSQQFCINNKPTALPSKNEYDTFLKHEETICNELTDAENSCKTIASIFDQIKALTASSKKRRKKIKKRKRAFTWIFIFIILIGLVVAAYFLEPLGVNINGLRYEYIEPLDAYSVERGLDFITTNKTEIKIPDTFRNKPVIEIKNSTFEDHSKLEKIVVSSYLEIIGINAFKRCSNLKEITLGHNIVEIGENAFFSCGKLKRIMLPNTVEYIGDGAFEYCNDIVSITVPESVTDIGNNIFRSCADLETVYINNPNLQSIGDYAFADCIKLQSIIFAGGPDVWLNVQKSSNWIDNSPNVAVTCKMGDDLLCPITWNFDIENFDASKYPTYYFKGEPINASIDLNPVHPLYPDYIKFLGWYTEPSFITKFDFNNNIEADSLELYAKWENWGVYTSINSVNELGGEKVILDLRELPANIGPSQQHVYHAAYNTSRIVIIGSDESVVYSRFKIDLSNISNNESVKITFDNFNFSTYEEHAISGNADRGINLEIETIGSSSIGVERGGAGIYMPLSNITFKGSYGTLKISGSPDASVYDSHPGIVANTVKLSNTKLYVYGGTGVSVDLSMLLSGKGACAISANVNVQDGSYLYAEAGETVWPHWVYAIDGTIEQSEDSTVDLVNAGSKSPV